ncbi:DUF397 domain-containing protein [Streptomyces lushanensis]|uniref:DUF397 domain-containing protein n=1 Tax=Streptomyces lushanensis TaxID=1434255 RepID=UPI000830A399|nr:DUF397 domain-containing protein [Streptomyces lushanensis]
MTTESPRWFTSSYSDNGGNCVEVAANLATSHGVVPVRDSKNPSGPVLDIPARAFTSFVASVKTNDLTRTPGT